MKEQSTDAWERLKKVMDLSGEKSVNAFAERIGLPRSEVLYRIQRGKNGISKSLASRIHDHFPQFNIPWLLFGSDTPKDYLAGRLMMIPLYSDITDSRPEHYIYLPDALTQGADIALTVENTALCNFLHNGAVVLLKKRDKVKNFDKIYQVVTAEVNALCRVKPGQTASTLVIIPVEGESPLNMVVETSCIRKLYEVCGIFII